MDLYGRWGLERVNTCAFLLPGQCFNGEFTIFVMHLPDFPGVSAFFDNIVIELIPKTCGRQLWPRDLGKWIEVDAIDIQRKDIKDKEDGKQLEQGPCFHVGKCQRRTSVE